MTTGAFVWRSRLVLTKRALMFAVRYVLRFFQPGRWTPLTVPEISIENTSICNSRCVFCPNGIMQRPRQAMKMKVFKKAVDEAVLLGTHDIDFAVTIGEPLLDPQLLERARHIKQFPQVRDMGFNTTIQWLHKFDLDEFFRAGFNWIIISTTLSGRDQYRNFFGVDGYDQMLANLTTLLRENNRREKPMLVELSIKPTPERRQDILNHPDFQLVQSLTSQNLRKTVKQEHFLASDWGGAVRLPSYLTPLPLWPRAYRPCNRLLRDLVIFPNGKVGACACLDFEASSELILGNVEETSLIDMWNGQHLAQLRSDWSAGKKIPDVCQQCRIYEPGRHEA
jgi:radical SAM protein with 4Fe4S-binding SPASM domain